MDRETLAAILLAGMESQDGPIDVKQLADFVLRSVERESEILKFKIESVISCPDKRTIKILWGDDVVTYAHFTQEADLVHMMGQGKEIERVGSPSLKDVQRPIDNILIADCKSVRDDSNIFFDGRQ